MTIETIRTKIEVVRTEMKMCRTLKTIALGDGDETTAAKCDAHIVGLKQEERVLLHEAAKARRAARR